MKLEEIDKLLADERMQGWHQDPLNRISILRKLNYRETDGHNNLVCQCNGMHRDREDFVKFIAAAPTIIKELVERVRKLEGTINNRFVGHLLSRNEELQREKGKMQAVVDAARKVMTPEGMDDFYASLDELKETLVELDAKEQDDD